MQVNGDTPKGLSLSRVERLKSELEQDTLLRESGDFCSIRMTLADDKHEYRLTIHQGLIQEIKQDASSVSNPVDFIIRANSEAWAGFFQSHPEPRYADILCMFTEKDAAITGNTELFWQNIQFIYGLFMLMGHRTPLSSHLAAKPETMDSSGHIEEVVGRYVHVELDGHTYRTFFEENGPEDTIPMVCLHAANIDARAWRHQLADPDYTSRFRVIAFDMPWHGRSLPPQELLRTEYLLTNDFYRRFVAAFCDALKLDRPILVGCSMGGYIMFYMAYHEPQRYRAFVCAAGRDYEPRRWGLERIIRSPVVSFNRFIPTITRGFMAPNDPVGCADEVAFVYETGSPQALRGDLYFAAMDCDARPFMGKIDTEHTPFYVLGGEYDWSCSEEHTDAIKKRMPGAKVIRMKGIGHHPADENPEVFKKYLLPCIDDALEMEKRDKANSKA